MTKTMPRWSTVVCCLLMAGCASPRITPSPGHLHAPDHPSDAIPEPVQQSAVLTQPKAAAKVETYSVTVHQVPVQSLLFALARDAGVNIDIHAGIDGTVTLNALNQTLPQLLSRIARQVDMRYEIDGNNLIVMPDAPVWRNYKVDYVNLARTTNSSVNIATQISTTGGGSSSNSGGDSSGAGAAGGAGGGGNNNSTTSVTNRSDNNFWYSLEKNIRDMLRQSNLNDTLVNPLAPPPDAAAGQGGAKGAAPAGQPGAAATQPAPQPQQGFDASQFGQRGGANNKSNNSVIVNAEGGLIAVRATSRQHEKIQEFLDIVLGAAKRQVLIEATIIEVTLSDQYQQGINWQSLGRGGLTLTQGQVGTATLPTGVLPGTSAGIGVISYVNPTSRLGNIAATIQLLESFGKVKVLSSPKISVLNNQTALLKVVDNNVFFSIRVTPAIIGTTGTISAPATYESHLETVPVGFVMSVTPQISDGGEVTLNVRPTITRIVGYAQDPNPALADAKVVSKVPVIQAREMESIMKVASGQIAVMGGLMQDSTDNSKDGVPGLSALPLIGDLFSYRNESSTKTELVIFMRPVVIKDASVDGDYKEYRYLLPGQQPDTSPYGDPTTRAAPARVNGS